jgi:hypothetical protein
VKKFIYISLVLAIIFIASAEKSFACSCMVTDEPLETQIQKAFDGSAAVFSGEVILVEPKDEYTLTVKIKSSQVWKGKELEEFTVNTSKQSTMCGYYFEIGKKYLVYANKSGEVLMTTNCSRTAGLNENGDAKYLNRFLQTPKKLPADIAEWVGEDSDKIFENTGLKDRLKNLLGEKDYASFTEYFETSKPIEKDGNFLFASGCMIRACTHLESAIAIDLKNNTIHAAIYNEIEDTKYFNENNSKTPKSIINWASSLENLKNTENQSKAVAFDEFLYGNSEDFMARFDAFTVQLQNQPEDSGYIEINGNKKSRAKVEKEIKKYAKVRGLDMKRLVFKTGDGDGDSKVLVKLWIVPEGAELPDAKNSNVQKSAESSMTKEALKSLITDLKEVVSKNSPDKKEAKLVADRWDKRKDLAGKSKSQVIELLYEDVKAVIKDSGIQYQIYSIFSFYKTIPDKSSSTQTKEDVVTAKVSNSDGLEIDEPENLNKLFNKFVAGNYKI